MLKSKKKQKKEMKKDKIQNIGTRSLPEWIKIRKGFRKETLIYFF